MLQLAGRGGDDPPSIGMWSIWKWISAVGWELWRRTLRRCSSSSSEVHFIFSLRALSLALSCSSSSFVGDFLYYVAAICKRKDSVWSLILWNSWFNVIEGMFYTLLCVMYLVMSFLVSSICYHQFCFQALQPEWRFDDGDESLNIINQQVVSGLFALVSWLSWAWSQTCHHAYLFYFFLFKKNHRDYFIFNALNRQNSEYVLIFTVRKLGFSCTSN